MPLLLANFSNWLTPLWLISAGALTGLVVLGLLFVGAWLAYRPATEAVGSSMREGFLFPVLVLAATWAVFAPIGASMVPFK